MNIRDLNQVDVLIDLERFGEPQKMGVLYRQLSRGDEVYSFEFDSAWLARRDPLSLDPDLWPVAGRIYARNKGQFGIFLDSSPDRWGRMLMQRREAIVAKQEKRPSRTLTDWDYLLGVHDSTRIGALRFRADDRAPFLDDSSTKAAPPLTSLLELQAVSFAIEGGDAPRDARYNSWIQQLLGPGSSLGGARPKASVVDDKGRLSIAKFPSRNDQRDMGAWEMLAQRLAKKAGMSVPETQVLKLTSDGHIFISRRFDRTPTGGRLAFVSAMTLLQRGDGEGNASYLELVELLQRSGSKTKADCEELFRRIVFSICISNTDDHLCNHGFLVDRSGISLSPAFDLNPNPEKNQLMLAIDESDASLNIEVALHAASAYGVTVKHAREIVSRVKKVARTWVKEAAALKIARAEQESMARAFEASV